MVITRAGHLQEWLQGKLQTACINNRDNFDRKNSKLELTIINTKYFKFEGTVKEHWSQQDVQYQ